MQVLILTILVIAIPELLLARPNFGTNDRSLYTIEHVPICSSKMVTISRQARMAASLLIDNQQYTSTSWSSSRSIRPRRAVLDQNSQNKHLISTIATQDSGVFSKKIYNKLKRVYHDIVLIEKYLSQDDSLGAGKVYLLKSTIWQLRESLQEEMNTRGTFYHEFATTRFSKVHIHTPRSLPDVSGKSGTKSRIELNINGLKTRAEAGLDSIVTTLFNLNNSCKQMKEEVNRRRSN